MALFTFVGVVFAPLGRTVILLVAVYCVRAGVVPGWLPRLYRFAEDLRPWAMLDVFLVGALISMTKLHDLARVTVAAEVSPGELADRVRKRVREGAGLVIIDSINGYLAVMWFAGHRLSNRPLLQLGVLLMLLGIQVLTTGLIGEMITFKNFRRRDSYSIKEWLE